MQYTRPHSYSDCYSADSDLRTRLVVVTALTLLLSGVASAESLTTAPLTQVSSVAWFNASDSHDPVRTLSAGRSNGDNRFAARVSRWMDTTISENLRSFDLRSTGGNGIDNWLELRHSQTDAVDVNQWNDDYRLSRVTEIALTQRTGSIWWHAVGAHTEKESQYHFGANIDRLTMSFGGGRGETIVRLGGNMNDVNPWFFSGGRDLPFSFSGATASFDMTDRTTVELGDWRFDMQGLETRRARFVGLQTGRFYSRLYDVSRRDFAHVANGVELGFRSNSIGMGYRELRQVEGMSTRELSFSFTGWRKANIGLALQHNTNPFYSTADEDRVLLTFSGIFGRDKSPLFGATEEKKTEEGDAKKKSNKGRNIALLGGGAVLVAAAAGGGGGGNEGTTNVRYPREQGAAYAVLSSFNPRCVAENREYGGWVYRNADGTFGHQAPTQGDLASVNIGPPTAVPSGSRSTATYHCHGGPDPRFDNESFSPQDIFADRFFDVNGYLSTPGGAFKKFDVNADTIRTIDRIRTQ